MPAPLICLITPGHLASTPRLLKEADALIEAGYRVHVVYVRHHAPTEALDRQILLTARWSSTGLNGLTGPAGLLRKLRRRFARWRLARTPDPTLTLVTHAQHAEAMHLAKVASRIPANFYLGHCLSALPAAAWAAQKRGVPYGFDLEDFHDAETEEATRDPVSAKAGHILQSRLLPACRHLTAASPLIARTYSEVYQVQPSVILNVFPLSQAPQPPSAPRPITAQRPACLYWFSQTVGPGRGLESVIAIMAQMRTPVELHLRGSASPAYVEALQAHARSVGLRIPVRFLDPGAATEMARLAANADLGLSTEESRPLNRDICLTNKIFIYLLAGIPQLLSNTTAQSALAGELGEAGLLANLADIAGTARLLDGFLSDPARVRAARKRAVELTQSQFTWDLEKVKFLASIRQIVGEGNS
jgi:glycosyltransferase involved in cell wall biosynthesis